ncbi:hypothetical protein [Paractinoplanes toevensis]|nr:hypothetical protein [Actinoplanes toevensis]
MTTSLNGSTKPPSKDSKKPTTTRRTGAKTPTAASAPATAAPVQRPLPTIRTMIVCVPDELSTQVLDSTRQLDRHIGATASSEARFWVNPNIHMWQNKHLIDLRKPKTGPRYCAGGPIRLLDLAGMRHGGALGASMRHQQWAGVVRGTRDARPWQDYLLRHLSDQVKYPVEQAIKDFEAQPRVLAMRAHNAATFGDVYLDPFELELLQAGPAAYANYHCMWVVCTDAVYTLNGARMQPASDSAADRLTYLSQAIRYVESLDPAQRLLAVTLA